MSFSNTVTTLLDSDDEYYEAQLARRHAEAETLLRQQEKKECLECQAHKEAKIAEQKKLKEEAQRKQKEEKLCWKEEECQRDLAHCLEADHITAVKQQWRKNWSKTFLLPPSPSSDEEMNLIDLSSLTKRQHLRYLPKETLKAC